MNTTPDENRIKGAWQGRVSGCILGKPVELVSMFNGPRGLTAYLKKQGALPLRDYVPAGDDPLVQMAGKGSCRGQISRAEPDDDINYTVLALMMLEEFGAELTTADVAVAWLRRLPAGQTFTAERAAYKTLLQITEDVHSAIGLPPGFDLSACSDNPYNQWIGAQIRADMYGWVRPGDPAGAAELARRDAALSHTGEGVNGAAIIAALAASIPTTSTLGAAIERALKEIPQDSEAAGAVRLGMSLADNPDGPDELHQRYKGMNPVHTVNNLALVIWGLLAGERDFSVAIGETVAAGWDTDCNGATVGGLWGLTGKPVPEHWTKPWAGRVAVSLAGVGELELDDLVKRTLRVAEALD